MDRITQLQDAIDQVISLFKVIHGLKQMATQFYSELNYLNTHHDFVSVNDIPALSDPQGTRREDKAYISYSRYP
jgi:hypothetical protein